jgi:hypothetical protein
MRNSGCNGFLVLSLHSSTLIADNLSDVFKNYHPASFLLIFYLLYNHFEIYPFHPNRLTLTFAAIIHVKYHQSVLIHTRIIGSKLEEEYLLLALCLPHYIF